MKKHFVAVALAACLWIPEAPAQSILQRSNWRDQSFATYLPAPTNSLPWLNLDRKRRWPKADFPIGREVNVAETSAFGSITFNMQVTETGPSSVRRVMPDVLEELRRPGVRRILEAVKSVKNESPALFDDTSIAVQQLSKSRAEVGHMLQ
jgi:hypothetical protein